MTDPAMKQCADKEPHPEHSWGHRLRCPGRNLTDGVDYYRLEALAALHHDTLRDWVTKRLGVCNVPAWGGLTGDAKRARIASMREVIKDLKAST